MICPSPSFYPMADIAKPYSPSKSYRGRFAPSPTGELHQGSLVAALASFLDAKAHQGTWLVRMEDLDPPREQAGAAAAILTALEAHHLYWDEPVLFQSQRLNAYADALARLTHLTYQCTCTRQRISDLGGIYDGHCRQRKDIDTAQVSATRVYIEPTSLVQLNTVDDIFLGNKANPLDNSGDFIIRRKDGLFAYQLAVAVDDNYQGITHVIRGADLFDSTNRQRYLLHSLGYDEPLYGHTPLVMLDRENKLSKQTGAKPLDNHCAFDNLCHALVFLNHAPPEPISTSSDIDTLLDWAIRHWQRARVITTR